MILDAKTFEAVLNELSKIIFTRKNPVYCINLEDFVRHIQIKENESTKCNNEIHEKVAAKQQLLNELLAFLEKLCPGNKIFSRQHVLQTCFIQYLTCLFLETFFQNYTHPSLQRLSFGQVGCMFSILFSKDYPFTVKCTRKQPITFINIVFNFDGDLTCIENSCKARYLIKKTDSEKSHLTELAEDRVRQVLKKLSEKSSENE